MTKKDKVKRIVNLSLLILTVVGFAIFFLYLEKGTIKEEEEVLMDFVAVGQDDLSSEQMLIAENTSLGLYLIEQTAELLIEDKQTGVWYRSNPIDAAEDQIAFGLNKTNVLSQLIVEYADTNGNFYTANSYLSSVRDGYVEYKQSEHGVLTTYTFAEQGFEIPVYYGIEEGCFTAKILCDEIASHGKYTITAISLLPYMGSGGLSDDGYLFVPDGSGSIIHFNNGKQSYVSYGQPVYGADAALNGTGNNEVKKDSMLPVFGIKKNDHAMLAVIANGEYQAEIKAEVSRKSTSNNIVYSAVRFVRVESSILFEGSANEEKTDMLSDAYMDIPEYEVRFYFLDEGSGYTEMALQYQNYLVNEKGMQPMMANHELEAGTPIHVTYIGGVELLHTMLGVPYQQVEALTSYQDVLRLSKALADEGGIRLNVRYAGYLKGGYQNSKLPSKVSLDSNLGGKKDFKRLIAGMDEAGIGFYPSFDPVRMYKTGNGFGKTDSARFVSRSAAYQYTTYLTTGEKNAKHPAYTLLTPTKVPKVAKGLQQAMKKNGLSTIALEGITDTLYSDFRKDGTSRNEAGQIFTSLLADISDDTERLLLDRAYGYALPYADVIVNVPISGSEFDCTDQSVPFYQIVMSGYAELYSEPVNMQGDCSSYILQMIEYGTYPSYLLMESEAKTVMNTSYAQFYANHYDDWKEYLIETARYLEPLQETYGMRIILHEKAEEVSKTVYENGICVYVNDTGIERNMDGHAIPARGYLLVDGKEAG